MSGWTSPGGVNWWNAQQQAMQQQAMPPQMTATMQGQQAGQAPGYGGERMGGSGPLIPGTARPWWDPNMMNMMQGAPGMTTAPGPNAGETTYTVPGQQTVANAGAPQPWLAGQQSAGQPGTEAKAGTGKSGQEQVAGAPKQEVTLATADSGWKPPSYAASVWQQIAAGLIRNGWGLDPQGARQNNGIILGYGSANPVTMIMPTDYNYGADTYRANVAGFGMETAMQRALRWTADEMAGNPNLNAMQVFAKNIRRVDAEARANGKSSGFNMAQIGGQGTGADAGVGAPPPTAPPPTAPPATAPPTPPPPANAPPAPTGPVPRGTITDEQVRIVMEAMKNGDTDAAMTLWRMFKYGSGAAGNGAFAQQIDSMMKPYILSGLQALDPKNIPTGNQVMDWFNQLSGQMSQTGGELARSGQNLAKQRMAEYAGKGNTSWDELTNQVQTLDPLFQAGLNSLNQQSYQRGRRDDFQTLYAKQLADPSGYYQYGNWWNDMKSLPWWQQWYGQGG